MPGQRPTNITPIAVSPAIAAEAIGVSRASIYNLIARGELTAHKIGRSTRIAVADLERLIGGEG
jgi:excisionase family DNA binding protein